MHILYRKRWLIAAGLLPALLVYILFVIFPIFNSVYYSFFDWDGFNEKIWVGWDNFEELWKDSVFWSSFRHNMIFLLFALFGQLTLGLLFAVVLNGKIIKGKGIYRSVFFMPVVLSTVVVSLFWSMMYNYQIGLINNLLIQLGLDSWVRNWLGEPGFAVFAICIALMWQYSGFYMVIFLSALQSVPADVLEAAEIDGAIGFRKTWSVTLPMISGTILTSVALCISYALKTFDMIFVMTKGGPNHATEVMATYMYHSSFSSLRYGYGSAISTAIIVLSFIFIFVSRTIMQKILR
jgi:raffinose/stachyose/melibiose transport system permease protein